MRRDEMKNVGYFSDINLKINKKDGEVNGFTLMGSGNTEAEVYCISFLTAQNKENTNIIFENGKIVFCHGGVSMEERNPDFGIWGGPCKGGKFFADIDVDDADKILEILSSGNIGIKIERAWGKGFILYKK